MGRDLPACKQAQGLSAQPARFDMIGFTGKIGVSIHRILRLLSILFISFILSKRLFSHSKTVIRLWLTACATGVLQEAQKD
jgi:hypothetical protein